MRFNFELSIFRDTNSFQLRWKDTVAHGSSIAEVFFNFLSSARGEIARHLFQPAEYTPVGEQIIEPEKCDGVAVEKFSATGLRTAYQVMTVDDELKIYLSGPQIVALVLQLVHHLNRGTFKEGDLSTSTIVPEKVG